MAKNRKERTKKPVVSCERKFSREKWRGIRILKLACRSSKLNPLSNFQIFLLPPTPNPTPFSLHHLFPPIGRQFDNFRVPCSCAGEQPVPVPKFNKAMVTSENLREQRNGGGRPETSEAGGGGEHAQGTSAGNRKEAAERRVLRFRYLAVKNMISG